MIATSWWGRALAASLVGTALLLPAGHATADGVTELRVSFAVDNVNRSDVPCLTDGQTYQLDARLVGPSALLAEETLDAAVLYVHGLGLSSYYWHFQDVPGYDHVTEMAGRGHVGVVYDRLGYGDNARPMGLDSCYGSDADIAAQLVGKLKAGDYHVDGVTPRRVDRVVVASHSQAGLIVQPMAYSFPVADAIVVTSWTDADNDPAVAAAASETALSCVADGMALAGDERPPFYAFFPQGEATFRDLYFHNADEAVVSAATRLREPDPCGQGGSLAQTLLFDQVRLGDITVPVLLVYGTHDGYRSQPTAGENHAERFSGSPDVSLEFLDETGNAITLERTAPQFRTMLAAWLCERELGDPEVCSVAPGRGNQPAGAPPQQPDHTPPPERGGPSADARDTPDGRATLPATGHDRSIIGLTLAMIATALRPWLGRVGPE